MPPLENQRHELFASHLAAGKTAREAFVEAGYTHNDGNASRLKNNEKIQARIAELKQQITSKIIRKTTISQAWVLDMLRENAERCMQHVAARNESGEVIGEYMFNPSGANRALELIGKELGMFVERRETRHLSEFEKFSDSELVKFLEQEAQALLEDHSQAENPDEKSE